MKSKMKHKRTLWTIGIAVVMVLLVLIQISIWSGQHKTLSAVGTFTVVHTGDVAGNLYETEGQMGFAKAATVMKQARREADHVLLVDSGNSMYGTVEVVANQGRPIVETMNLLGYDIMNLGANDFLYGRNTLTEVKKSAEFDVMSANLYLESGLDYAMPYRLKEIGSLKVGIIGLMDEADFLQISQSYTDGLTVQNQIDAAKKSIKMLKKYTNVIVAVTHLSTSQVDALIEAVPDIDVVFNAYDPQSPDAHQAPRVQDGTLVCSTGQGMSGIGMTQLTFEKGALTGHTYTYVDTTAVSDLEADDETVAQLNQISAQHILTGDQRVGEIVEDLNGNAADNQRMETNFGCILADAMKEDGQTDVAFVTGSAIAKGISQGTVYKRDVYAAVPNGDMMVTLELTGQEIVDVLEASVASNKPSAQFLQISGIAFSYDPSAKIGQRLDKVMIDGMPLVVDQVYTATTTVATMDASADYAFLKEKSLKQSCFLHEALIAKLKTMDAYGDSGNYKYIWPRISKVN